MLMVSQRRRGGGGVDGARLLRGLRCLLFPHAHPGARWRGLQLHRADQTSPAGAAPVAPVLPGARPTGRQPVAAIQASDAAVCGCEASDGDP